MSNGKLGLWLFLASEAMLFGGLFSAYIFIRTASESWSQDATVLFLFPGVVNTVILLFSSVTLVLSRRAFNKGLFTRFRTYQISTLFLGAVFLAVTAYEYVEKIRHGLLPAVNNFLALYFTLSGIHALHLLGGMVVLGLMKVRGRASGRLEVLEPYWHFVGLVWICIFSAFYVF